ncbi:hypothetical protein [uncultured Roseibium sp.]|uniref:hypothetical protein n=1 Tax=uncultured Roseibium sp. TaxID=1936171 RepID=UPI00260FB72B|nr:hypothetical protein [uncultured Roseibium sp.]
MSFFNFHLRNLGFAVALAATPVTAQDQSIEACLAEPKAPCVDVFIESLMNDLEQKPERALEGEHVSRVANMLAFSPRLDQAAQLAQYLNDFGRGQTLARIASRHAILGEIDEARRVMQQVTATHDLDNIRLELSLAETKRGDLAAARKVISEIEAQPIRDGALSALADHLIDKKDFGAAIGTTRQSTDPMLQSFVLARVVTHSDEPKWIDQAIEVTRQIEDPAARVRGIVQLAVVLTTEDLEPRALALFDYAEALVQNLQDDDSQKQALRATVYARMVEAGLLERALPAVELLDSVREKTNLLTFIALQYEKRGDAVLAERLFEQSIAAALDVGDAEARDKELGFVLSRLSRMNIPLRESAPMLAGKIEDPKKRGETIVLLAMKFAQLDRFGFAERLMRPIEHQTVRVNGLMNLAWLLAQKEREVQAKAIYNDVITEIEASGGLGALQMRTRDQVLSTAAKLGDFERIHQMALQIEDRQDRIMTLSDIALAAIDAGHEMQGRGWLHDAARQASGASKEMSRTDLLYRLSFHADRIGGIEEMLELVALIEEGEMRQLFIYEVARHWLGIYERAPDARELINRYGSAETISAFRERDIEVTLARALMDEGENTD